jgi:DNA-directed RNA polymerase subunit RPC12/RpoP
LKLYYYCSSCKKENSFNTKASNRFELQEERGNHINDRCNHCGTQVKRRVNRVHAKPDIKIVSIGLLLGIISTIFLWNLGWIATLTFSIPILAFSYASQQASNFNKVMVDDK